MRTVLPPALMQPGIKEEAMEWTPEANAAASASVERATTLPVSSVSEITVTCWCRRRSAWKSVRGECRWERVWVGECGCERVVYMG